LHGATLPIGVPISICRSGSGAAKRASREFSSRLSDVDVIAYQQNFTFLPKPFDGLGFTGSLRPEGQ